MKSRPVGSIIGAIGGLLFVVLNAAAVPITPVWWVLALAAFAGVIWFAVLRGPTMVQEPPSRVA